jgi:hypothetical protein
MNFRKKKIPGLILLVSLAALLAGLILGEYPAVLEKAVTVCLGCIGIG